MPNSNPPAWKTSPSPATSSLTSEPTPPHCCPLSPTSSSFPTSKPAPTPPSASLALATTTTPSPEYSPIRSPRTPSPPKSSKQSNQSSKPTPPSKRSSISASPSTVKPPNPTAPTRPSSLETLHPTPFLFAVCLDPYLRCRIKN